MAKIYSKEPSKSEKLNPKKETVRFLLNYSKALNVKHYKEITFDTFLN